MEAIKNIIVFDTEFVFDRNSKQPIQLALTGYELKDKTIEKISTFSVFITLKRGTHLNKYVRSYTGIDESKLKSEGIYPNMAQRQAIEYILSFDLKTTILCGWAIGNDLIMFDALFNDDGELLDVNCLKWLDLGKAYSKINKEPNSSIPALKNACEKYGIGEFACHNANDDCNATALLLEKMLEKHGNEVFNNSNFVKLKKKKKNQ